MEVSCQFIYTYDDDESGSDTYACHVFDKLISEEKVIKKFNGTHEIRRFEEKELTNDDVNEFQCQDCYIPRVPYGLSMHFKFLKSLRMNSCQLSEIHSCDLRGMENLINLDLSNNFLVFLPGNLLVHTKKLEEINFSNNSIKFIEPEIFHDFHNLRVANFKENSDFDIKFDFWSDFKTFEDFKVAFKEICLTSMEQKLKEENQKIKILRNKPVKELIDEINEILLDDSTTDFTIKVGENNFKVHKLIFMARSKLFAETIRNNPKADQMELKEISKETFEEVLSFVYFDNSPADSANLVEVFSTAGKLEIQGLLELTAKNLMKKIDHENAFDILILSNVYNHDELRMKAFEMIKKMFPGHNLKDDLAKYPGKLIHLMEVREAMEKELEKLELNGKSNETFV